MQHPHLLLLLLTSHVLVLFLKVQAASQQAALLAFQLGNLQLV
jgi:hypothetical protein